MSQTSLLVFGVGYVVIFGGLTAWLASTKNRDGCSWFVLGALIGPLALLAVGLAPATQKPTQPSQTRAAPAMAGRQPWTKVCPQCAEEVKSAALVCRFCGYEFPVTPTGQRAQFEPHPCWCGLVKGDHDIRDHPPVRQE
jgi:hypothetical protein